MVAVGVAFVFHLKSFELIVEPFMKIPVDAVKESCFPASCTWTPAKDVVTAASFAFRANCVFAHVCVAISVGCPIVNSIFPVPMFTVSVIV